MENYEQKFKEAMSFLKDLRPHMSDYCKEKLDDYFPELKESEDERIIRTLKEIVNWGCAKNISVENNVELKDCLAWLEKQGEKSWSEEDEDILDIAIRIIQNGGDDCAGILDSNKALRWLKSLKDRVQPQPKQEWSEYDKIQLDEAIQMIEANGTWIRSEDAVKKVSNWLKSLKPCWKPTKEQLKALRNLLSGSFSMDNSKTYQSIESLYNDLKSL